MWYVVTDRVVGLSVGRSVCHSRERYRNSWTNRDAVFLLWARVGPRNHVLDVDLDPPRKRQFGRREGAAHCKVYGAPSIHRVK